MAEYRCWDCKRTLDEAAFTPSQRTTKPGCAQCQECRHAYGQRYYLAHPERWRNKHLVDNYGITLSEWETLAIAQEHRCASCNEPFAEEQGLRPVTDHVGDSIRGILHDNCNKGIGFLGDDLASVSKAVEYLRRFEESRP